MRRYKKPLILLLTFQIILTSCFASNFLAPRTAIQPHSSIYNLDKFPLSLILFLFETDQEIVKYHKAIHKKFLTHLGQRGFNDLPAVLNYFKKQGSPKIKEFHNNVFLKWLAENNNLIFTTLQPLLSDKYKIINTKISLKNLMFIILNNIQKGFLHQYKRKIKDKNKNAWEDLLEIISKGNNRTILINDLLKANSYLYYTKAVINEQTAGIVTYDLLRQLQMWIVRNINFVYSWLPEFNHANILNELSFQQSA